MPDFKTHSSATVQLHQRLANIYTPLDEAVAELDSASRRAMRSKLDASRSPLREKHPFAIHIGHLATPNFGIERFLELAASAGLPPLFWEFHRDKFVSCNPCKRSLGRMGFFMGRNRHNEDMKTYRNVVCFSQNGRQIADTKTLWGQPLIEFHHDLLFSTCPQVEGESCWDASDWYHEYGPTPLDYYRELFTLLLSGGVLFESFLLDRIEYEFTRDVVVRAFYEVWQTFGLKPLVVRLDPLEKEGDPYWLLYSGATGPIVQKKLGVGV